MNKIIIAAIALITASPRSHGQIMEINETFTNANTGGAASSGFSILTGTSLISPGSAYGPSTFLLQQGDSDDLSLLGDGALDGYGLIDSMVGSSNPRWVGVRYDFGTLDASDVGKIIQVDLAYLEVSGSASLNFNLILDGVALTGGARELGVTTFGTDPNSGIISLNYEVLAGDIGKTFTYDMAYFDSSSGGRHIGIDQFVVTIVPEPSSTTLLGLAGFALILRRRR